MYYPSRQFLGEQLAMKLDEYRDNETIVFCLKRESLLACLELAARLHAYIYILQYSVLSDPYDFTRTLGAVASNGNFILNPDITTSEYEYIHNNYMTIIEQEKQKAFSQLNAEQDLNPSFELSIFNNRKVLLFADILKTTFQLQIAFDILKPFGPSCIYGAFGNITPSVSDKLQLEADGLVYMDVLSSTVFDDSHYFDLPDAYSDDQKIKMANNISLYWAQKERV